MQKFLPIFCVLLLAIGTTAVLPEIERIGKVPRKCPRQSVKKLKSISRTFLEALHTCFSGESGDVFLPLYTKDTVVFGSSNALIGIDAIAETFIACEVPPPIGVKGLQFTRILESIAANSVYYLFTVSAPGFQDYNFSTAITTCRSKIVRTVATLDTTELVPVPIPPKH